MENTKNNKIFYGIVVILIIIIALMSFYIVINEMEKKDKEDLKSNTIDSENINKDEVEGFFVIYHGVEILRETGIQELNYIDKSDIDNSKYNTGYSLYRGMPGTYRGEQTDDITLVEEYEDCFIIDEFVGRGDAGWIAISKKYDAIPREVEEVLHEEILEQLLSVGNRTDEGHTVFKIDLDGDGTDEYVSITRQIKNKTCHSEINLFDHNHRKIALLAYLDVDGYEEGEPTWIGDLNIIDIDDDNNMEILIHLPSWEGRGKISILKYNNGTLSGEIEVEATIEP